jgi:multidrug resistance protein
MPANVPGHGYGTGRTWYGVVKSDNFPLGEIVSGGQVIFPVSDSRRMRNVILLLSGSVLLMMTGFGIIFPIFARRLEELGGGVQTLGMMTMSFALAQLLGAPLLGSLADRIGRRPPVLLALAAFSLANIGFLFARSTIAFIIIRILEGAFTAGLFPSAMGVVSDVVPEKNRAQWIGVVMASYGAGFFLGPVIGGVLYDLSGYSAPFMASAGVAFLAFISALIMVPETWDETRRKRERLRKRWEISRLSVPKYLFWDSFPQPLSIFFCLLALDFIVIFAFAFVEPQMIFYMYDKLGWTTVQFGILISVYGLTTVIGQGLFGRSSDHYGRKPIIILGMFLNSFLYLGLAFLPDFYWMLLVTVISGLGDSMIMPALSAFYLDITPEQHRSRVIGIKESVVALGGVAGPLLVAVLSPIFTPRGIFGIALGLMLVTVLVSGFILRSPARALKEDNILAREYVLKRAVTAQATLQGIVTIATSVRGGRNLEG